MAVAGTDWEPYVTAIIQVERTVHTRIAATGLWKNSQETAFYLSNRPIQARKAARKIRDHWAIENRQHYVRDVTMAEDASRIRVNPGIFARLRSFAYNILRFNQSDTIAQDRFAAACGGVVHLLSPITLHPSYRALLSPDLTGDADNRTDIPLLIGVLLGVI